MANVSVEDVRDVLHVSDADISDAIVLKMVKRDEVTLGLELSVAIDFLDCSGGSEGGDYCFGCYLWAINWKTSASTQETAARKERGSDVRRTQGILQAIEARL